MVYCKIEKVIVFVCLCLWWSLIPICVKAENDSLKLGDTLNATTELCSKQSKFCMGFSRNLSYLRMYPKEQSDWVWIANRDQPVDQDSAVLSLNYSGVLKIECKIRDPIILYSSPQPVNNNIVVTLLDTGNFVVQQVHPNGMKSTLLWQSFDYPTDSLMPGMKLGVNHKTGQNWSLVSYLSNILPASGPFRLEWEHIRRELVINHREQVYWRSEPLKKNSVDHMSSKENLYKTVSNKDEDYFTILQSTNEELTIWTILETGQLMKRGGRDIARADICYGYNTNGGCQKWEEKPIPSCRNAHDVFDLQSGYPNPKMLHNVENDNYSISDCQANCWSNCSCNGFNTLYPNGTGCQYLLSIDGFNNAAGGSQFYILMSSNHKGKKNLIWKSSVIAVALLILCPSILWLAFKKRKYGLKEKKGEVKMLMNLEASNESSIIKEIEDELKEHGTKVLNYTSILEATSGFSPENKLGKGGYGPVYKGILPTGQEIAIKRLSKTSRQGIMEFKNELTLISELQHTNLVQLVGCCICEEERILVYEYMSNKSLDFYLFDCTRSKLVDWKTRFNIIEGISQGLLYLHKYSRLKVIHRDLKASNILLDENMHPKISDFGMARMFTQESAENTNKIVGTYGYMSPEYVMEGIFSTKSDIYSFGVLLLEIISGRRNNSFYDDDRPLNLTGYAWELWKAGKCLHLMDPSLNNTFIPDEVQRCIHIGLLCVEHYANNRPTMSDIISMLTNKSKLDILPRKPAFYVEEEILDEITTSIVSKTYFSDEISTCKVK